MTDRKNRDNLRDLNGRGFSSGHEKSRSATRRVGLEEARNLPVQRKRRRTQRRRSVVAVLAIIATVIVAGLVYAWGYMNHLETVMQPDEETQALVGEVTTQPESSDDPFTILLLGDDSRSGETMQRSDTMIVLRVDPQTGEVWALSIPRDTHVEITGYGDAKINAATAYGGPALAIETAEDFLGIEINYYMTVNFTGFVEMVDALGGVYVNVESDIDDPKAATHSDDPDAAHIAAGYQLLDGVHALTFVRTRDYADADFGRMRNQQAFLKALVEQMKSAGNIVKLPSIIQSVAGHVETNMPMMQLINAALAVKGSGSDSIYTATLSGTWDSPYVWTDEDLKADLVRKLSSGVPFDNTSAVDDGAIDPADVDVTVRNGSGEAGVASAAASVLSGAGFAVKDVGNASQFVYEHTLVVYDEDSTDGLEKAQAVNAALPIGDIVASNGMYSFSTDVLVVVGHDWGTVIAAD